VIGELVSTVVHVEFVNEECFLCKTRCAWVCEVTYPPVACGE